ncbi:hypothetical protein [Spirosoma arcticum]
MKLRDWIILLICTTTNIIVCSIVILKFGVLSSNDLSVALNLLGPATTVAAIVVAYRAYQNQADANRSNISKTTLNMLLSEMQANRNALNTISYPSRNDRDVLEYGGKATANFARNFWLKPDPITEGMTQDQIDDFSELPAQYLAKEAVYQFEGLLTTISTVESNRNLLEYNDLHKAQHALKNLVQDYFLQYNPVFETLIRAVKGGNLQQRDLRGNMFYTLERLARRYMEIRQELVNQRYVVRIGLNPRNLSANLQAQEIANATPNLMRRISELDELPYKLSDE